MVLIVPFAILAYWGETYLRDVFHSLEAPGVPIRVTYNAAGGPVNVEAASYLLDLRRGYFRANRVRVSIPTGKTFVSVASLEASGLKPLQLADQIVRVRVVDVSGTVTRLRTGKFDISGLLPKQKGPPSKIPFEVEVQGAHLNLVDEAGKRPWREALDSSAIHVAGVGRDWIASADCDVANLGRFPLRIENVSGSGLRISTEARGEDFAPIIRHILTTPEFRRYDPGSVGIGSLRVVGRIGVLVPLTLKSSALPVEVDSGGMPFAVDATRLKYRQASLDHFSFRGIATSKGLRGRAQFAQGANRADFDGSAGFLPSPRAAGHLSLASPSDAALPTWLRPLLHVKGSYRDARFDGWVAYAGPGAYRAVGDAKVGAVAHGTDWVHGADAHVSLDPSTLSATIRSAVVDGQPIDGSVRYEFKSQVLLGDVQARHVDIGAAAKRFKVSGVGGDCDVVVTIAGPLAHPSVEFQATGHGLYRQQKLSLGGDFELAARYGGEDVVLQRALVQGAFGLATVTGTVSRQGNLALSVTGRDLDPSLIDPRVSGEVNVTGTVAGTFRRPTVSGYLEGYELAVDRYVLPVVESSFVADLDHVKLTDLQATQGTAQVTGAGSLRFADQAISGTFEVRTLQLADFLNRQAFGSIDIEQGVVSGTVTHPFVSASVSGEHLFAQGIQLDGVAARLTTDGHSAQVEEIRAQIPDAITGGMPGWIKGTASYDIDHRSGSAEVDAGELPLDQIGAKIGARVSVAGRVSGTIHAEFDASGVQAATGKGQLSAVKVNESAVGDGSWQASLRDGMAAGSARLVGGGHRIDLQDAGYRVSDGRYSGKIDVTGYAIPDIVQIEEGLDPDLSPSIEADLATLLGALSIKADVTGVKDDISVTAESIHGDAIQFRGLNFGNLDAVASLVHRKVTLSQFALAGGALRLTASGSYDQLGDVDLEARATKVELKKLAQVLPELSAQSGTADVILDATGPSDHPDLQASVELHGLLLKSGEDPDQALQCSLVADADAGAKSLTVSGRYNYRGFQGLITAGAPYDYPPQIPKDAKVTGGITVDQRSLKDMATLVPGLDSSLTDGMVKGKIDVAGPLDHLQFSGGLTLQASRLGFEIPAAPAKEAEKGTASEGKTETKPPPATKVGTSLRNVNAQVLLEGTSVRVKLDADSSQGGHVSADVATSSIPDAPAETEATLRNGVLTTGLVGRVTLTKLAGRQSFAGKTYVTGTVDGKIAVGGTIGRPSLDGALNLTKVDSNVPTAAPSQGEEGRPVIEPSFNLQVNLAEPAHLHTGTADLMVHGQATVGGTLAAPSMHGAMFVDSGSVLLPAAKVRLDEGGSITPTYEPAPGAPIVSVDVDMVGRTALTALRYGDLYQRYDITLAIKGDLLREGGLNLEASSIPSDLSSDRILALLGESTLAENPTSGNSQADTERRLRDAFTQFLVPSLTDPITSAFAKPLGLDYVSLQYNSYEQATAIFAKSLGTGFSIQGRRQIGDPPPGFKSIYDIRLVYTPRRARGFLNQISFSFGADQDRPWKVNLDYGFKF